MAKQYWAFAMFCGLVCFALACTRLENHVRSHALECGGDATYDSKQRIYKIFLDGRPVAARDVAKLSLNGTDIANRISPKGCFNLDPHDNGVVAVAHRSGRHALVWDSSKDALGRLHSLNLEFLKPINLDPKDKDIIFRDFCSEPNDTLYLPKAQLSFLLNFSPMGRSSVLNAISKVHGGEQNLSTELITSARLVEPIVEAFTISLPETNVIPSQVEIDVVDVYGNRITSNKCDVVVDPNAPRLLSIAKSPYFQNMFVRSASVDSIEFSLAAAAPIRKFEIEYLDAKSGAKDRVETHVPFSDKAGFWKVLAPLPALSGVKNILITIESSSGLKVYESAVMNFGEKRYVNGGVKIAKTSQNEEFMVVASYSGHVKVLELKSDKVIYEKNFDDNVNHVDLTNDARKVILGLSAVDLIVDTKEGKTLEFKEQFSKFGFRLDRDQTAVIG